MMDLRLFCGYSFPPLFCWLVFLMLMHCPSVYATETESAVETPINEVPINKYPYNWQYSATVRNQSLIITDIENQTVVASYGLDECLFCESGEDNEDNCHQDGIFEIDLFSVDQPLLGVVCHVGAHSQRFMLFAPLIDAQIPVFSVTGLYVVQVTMSRVSIAVEYDVDTEGQTKVLIWPDCADSHLSPSDLCAR